VVAAGLQSGNCLVVAGPSGAGKSTLIRRALEANRGWQFSISATTRRMRESEQEGADYYFLDETSFRLRINRGEFMEYAEVYGNYYGTLWSEFERASAAGKLLLVEVDTVGSLSIAALRPEIPMVAVLPPNIAELRRRLEGRSTETPESLRRRLANEYIELVRLRRFDYAIVNDDLDCAVRQLLDIMRVVEDGLPRCAERVDKLLLELKEEIHEA
jgi:guanylate kinase